MQVKILEHVDANFPLGALVKIYKVSNTNTTVLCFHL